MRLTFLCGHNMSATILAKSARPPGLPAFERTSKFTLSRGAPGQPATLEPWWMCRIAWSNPLVQILSAIEYDGKLYTLEGGTVEGMIFFCVFDNGAHGNMGSLQYDVKQGKNVHIQLRDCLLYHLVKLYPQCTEWSLQPG